MGKEERKAVEFNNRICSLRIQEDSRKDSSPEAEAEKNEIRNGVFITKKENEWMYKRTCSFSDTKRKTEKFKP